MSDLFSHFTSNMWIYESVKVNDYLKMLREEDLKEFPFDPKTIDWYEMVHNFVYGIKGYIL